MIETKGCDSGCVGSAPVPAVCFQWNLGEVIRSIPLTQNLLLFLSFLLSWEILVTGCAFVCLPHRRCPLMQAGQPAFSCLGKRVQVWEFWGPFLERRTWSHAQICYQESCLLSISPPILSPPTSPLLARPSWTTQKWRGREGLAFPLPTVKPKYIIISLLLSRCGNNITQIDVDWVQVTQFCKLLTKIIGITQSQMIRYSWKLESLWCLHHCLWWKG